MFYLFIPISNLIIFILLEAVILNISYLSAALNNLRFLSLSTLIYRVKYSIILNSTDTIYFSSIYSGSYHLFQSVNRLTESAAFI